MGNPTNQQRIEQLEQGMEEMVQHIDTRLNTELARLEEKMAHNQAVLESKNTDLEKSLTDKMAQMIETQSKMQDSINRLVSSNFGSPSRASILGNPPPWPRNGNTIINNSGEWPNSGFVDTHERRDEHGSGGWRLKRIELPVFTEGNPDGWFRQAERFFSFYKMKEEEKMEATVVSLQGDALFWYQWEEQEGEITCWNELKYSLLKRFRPRNQGGLVEQWLSVKQKGKAADYCKEFIEKLTALGKKMEMLFQMAQRGDVEELNQLLITYPLLLHQIPLISIHNPLHIASALGHLDFAKKLLELKPEFARQLDAEGYSPMHLACANGHIEIVREFIKVDPHICRLEGREGRTPLHVAVLGGRVVELQEMLANCEGCIEDVTVQKENCFHLAVKNFQYISFQVLLDWAREMRRDEVLNRKDEHGNTILHLAVWKKQRQVLEMLLTNSSSNLEVNAINNSSLTALDLLLIFPSEAGDREIQDILQGAGALKSRDLALNNTTSPSLTRDSVVNNCSNSLIEYFRFHDGRDSPSDVRTTLLVIAVLVVTATYQVGISPPGDVWQDDDQVHLAGTSILGTHNLVSYILLVSFNSIGFNVSLYMIGTLTRKFPLQTELRICLFALYVTFNVSVTATSPKSARLFTTVFTSALPTAVPVACGLLQRYGVVGRFRRLFLIFRTTS